MKFLKMFLPLFALFFSVCLQADDRRSGGLYVATEVYNDLGLGVGYQFGLTGTFAMRFEAMHRPELLDVGTETLNHNVQRYGGFLDLGLGDSDSFIYLGSALNRSNLVRGLSLESGVIWRATQNFAVRLGHEYRSWHDFDGDGRNHTFRFGIVHFFRAR